MDTVDPERARFETLFRTCAPRVHAYARRHVDAPLVDEVVSETFLVAWRRRERVPPDDPVPWLLVTARHTIANLRRRVDRVISTTELLDRVAAPAAAIDAPVLARDEALAALASLTDREREAVLLVAWDGLEPAAAAAVARCSKRAFTVRLHRARQRLDRLLRADDPGPGIHSLPTRLAQESR